LDGLARAIPVNHEPAPGSQVNGAWRIRTWQQGEWGGWGPRFPRA
jgi:hypothetical protein